MHRLFVKLTLVLATLALAGCGGLEEPDPLENVVIVDHGTSAEAVWGMLWGTTCSCAGQLAPECPYPTTSLGSYCSPYPGGCSLQAICQSPPNNPTPPPADQEPPCGPGTGRICN